MRKDMTVEYGENFIRVADPVVNGVIKASDTSVSLPCAAVDGDVLISLDVNGTNVAHRELFTMNEGSVTVGDYTVAYESGAVTITTTSNNDVVSICIEPVEVVVSAAFRAAVGEAAPDAPSELPAVTASDAGKVLTASTVTEKGAVIVPEQTKMIQKNTYTVLDDTDASLFTDGASVIVSIASTSETVERTATVASGAISVADISDGVTITIAKDGNEIKAQYNGSGLGVERTISVNLASVCGVWGASMPDFIVTLYTSGELAGTMDKTNAEIQEAFDNGKNVYFKTGAAVLGFDTYLPVFRAKNTEATMYDAFIAIAPFEIYDDGYKEYIVGASSQITNEYTYETTTLSPFIVTLTPTAADYSGTMDHTVAEIDAAYKTGRKIVFRLYTAVGVFIDVPVQLVSTDTDYEYPSFETSVIQVSSNALIFASTGTTSNGTEATYSTKIYTLTPAT